MDGKQTTLAQQYRFSKQQPRERSLNAYDLSVHNILEKPHCGNLERFSLSKKRMFWSSSQSIKNNDNVKFIQGWILYNRTGPCESLLPWVLASLLATLVSSIKDYLSSCYHLSSYDNRGFFFIVSSRPIRRQNLDRKLFKFHLYQISIAT